MQSIARSNFVETIVEQYRPYGTMIQAFQQPSTAFILSGPAGTGKTRFGCELLNYVCMKYPKARTLMMRKTRKSLTESAMATLENKVLHPSQGVHFSHSKQQYQYTNRSIIAVAGLDKPTKVLSSEWDMIYIPEAQEDEQDDWEICSTRLRNNVLPIQVLFGDCNPGSPTHWIKQKERNKTLVLYETRHEDNPTLFQNGILTEEGRQYIARLDELTGVRYARYRLGLWVAAEGMVYEDVWNNTQHLVSHFQPPKEWARYLSVDFGYTNPFVCQWWAEDPDGRLYLYRELYQTKTLVEDHAKAIKEYSHWSKDDGDPFPRVVICDHDAEDRATLERHLGLATTPAHKSVRDGIQAVASRLKLAGDGKPRLMLMRDCLVQKDRELQERKKPTCTAEEVESYIWQQDAQGQKEEPVKENDHGMDSLRYMVAYKDVEPRDVTYFQVPRSWR